MSADPIIYCLEQLTDYRQFERLCSDIMAGSGYENIEPLFEFRGHHTELRKIKYDVPGIVELLSRPHSFF